MLKEVKLVLNKLLLRDDFMLFSTDMELIHIIKSPCQPCEKNINYRSKKIITSIRK